MPKIAKSFLKSEANKLKRQAIRRAKRTINEKTGNYINGFTAGKKVYGYKDSRYNIMVRNDAPHAHLIEYGHNMVNHDGEKVGFVPGKHILEDTSTAFQKTYAKDIENALVKKVIKELER
jgi:hypothetical protein